MWYSYSFENFEKIYDDKYNVVDYEDDPDTKLCDILNPAFEDTIYFNEIQTICQD